MRKKIVYLRKFVKKQGPCKFPSLLCNSDYGRVNHDGRITTGESCFINWVTLRGEITNDDDDDDGDDDDTRSKSYDTFSR